MLTDFCNQCGGGDPFGPSYTCDVCRMENDPVTGLYPLTVERACIFCGTLSIIRMNPETAKAYAKWTRGEGYIQDVPGLTVDQREVLLSGICGPCFDEVTTEDSQ